MNIIQKALWGPKINRFIVFTASIRLIGISRDYNWVFLLKDNLNNEIVYNLAKGEDTEADSVLASCKSIIKRTYLSG